MEKDTFDQIKRASKNGVNENMIEISPTGYGYVSADSRPQGTDEAKGESKQT